MTDRELLEAAAKAAGMHANTWADIGTLLPAKGGWVQFIGHGTAVIWNPLVDDAEAFRLAVKLRLDIDNGSPSDGNRYVCAYRCGIAMVRDPVSEIEEIEDECQRLAATRRAIVRAAAEIGAAIGGEKP